MLDIHQVRDIIAAAADKPATKEKIGEFCWGELKKIPDMEGIIYWENGWYNWFTDGYMKPHFKGPVPDDELIGYLAAHFMVDAGPWKMEKKRFNELIFLPCYNSLEEITEYVRRNGSI